MATKTDLFRQPLIFPEKSAELIPSGSGISGWTSEHPVTNPEDLFALSVNAFGSRAICNTGDCFTDGTGFQEVNTQIKLKVNLVQERKAANGVIYFQPQILPDNLEFRVVLKLNRNYAQSIGNWYSSRSVDPKISTESSGNFTFMTFEGAELKVPVAISGALSNPDVQSLGSFASNYLSRYIDARGNQITTLSGTRWEYMYPNSPGEQFFEKARVVEKKFGLKTAYLENSWSFESDMPVPHFCFNSLISKGKKESLPSNGGVAGILSTNASIYSARAPQISSKERSIDFRIAAPHFREDGKTKTSGLYSLKISRKLATCLWGDLSQNSRAVISVVSDDGESRISTSTFGYDDYNVYFRASGFEFSSPTIKLSIGNVKSVSKICAKPKAAKSTQVTCIKPSAV